MKRALILAAAVALSACKKPEAPKPEASEPAGGWRPPYMDIANYTGSAVTVTLNGQRVGSWTKNERVDLPARPGENSLEIDVAPPASGDLRLYVKRTRKKDAYATETEELLSLKLGGKPGRHAASFVAP